MRYVKVLAHRLPKFDWHDIALLTSGRFVVAQAACGGTLKIALHHKKMGFYSSLPQTEQKDMHAVLCLQPKPMQHKVTEIRTLHIVSTLIKQSQEPPVFIKCVPGEGCVHQGRTLGIAEGARAGGSIF